MAKLSGAAEVDAFMAGLEHPLRGEIERVREVVCGVSEQIGEGIKWKSPSFCKGEWFATVNLRSTEELQMIFHLGAKVREIPVGGLAIDDPKGLVKWLAKDRAMVRPQGDWEALAHVVKQWIKYV